MLSKRITTNGHIYAKLGTLQQWDKNPRDIYTDKFNNLKILIATLGLFKPFFVTAEGIMVGGNMRLPAVSWLNENVLNWVDDKGVEHTVDKRGQFEEVPITELDFAQDQNNPGKYKAMLDGVIQEKLFDSVEQAMIEYAIADNQPSGYYDQQKAAELFLPHQESIDMKVLDVNLAPPVSMRTFVDQYQPANNEGPHLPDPKDKKSKEINIIIKYTPEQFAEIEPRIEKLKNFYGVENVTDFFNSLLQQAEEVMKGDEHVNL